MKEVVNLPDLVGMRVLAGFEQFEVGLHVPASDWIVMDIRINGRPILAGGSGIPGDMFASNGIDPALSMDVVQAQSDMQMDVSYVGPIATGAPFRAAVLGSAPVSPEVQAQGLMTTWYNIVGASGRRMPQPQPTRRETLPMTSRGNVLPGEVAPIVSRVTSAFRPERIAIIQSESTRHVLLRLDDDQFELSQTSNGRVTFGRRGDVGGDLPTPHVLTIRSFGEGPMIYAVDERSGEVVLEAGTIVHVTMEEQLAWDADDDDEQDENGDPIAPRAFQRVDPAPRTLARVERHEHFLRFDLDGFMPTWWPLLDAASAEPVHGVIVASHEVVELE